MKTSFGVMVAVALVAGGCVTKSYGKSVDMTVTGDGAGGARLVATDTESDFKQGDRVERRHDLKIDSSGRATPATAADAPHMIPIVDAAFPRELGTAPALADHRFGVFTTEGKLWVLERSGDQWRAHERTDADDLRGASVDDDGTLRTIRVTESAAGSIRTRGDSASASAVSRAPDFITVQAIGFDKSTRFTTTLRGVPFGISFARDGHIAIGIGGGGVSIVDRDGELRPSQALALPGTSTRRGVVAYDHGVVVAWAGTSAIRLEPSGATRHVDTGFDILAAASEGDELILGGATDEELTVARFDAALGTKWRLSGCDCARADVH
jgi:hypothetical protein